MAISVAEFKQAFAGKVQTDGVAQRDAQVATALKQLHRAIGSDGDDAGGGLQAALKKLVERYERARTSKGDAAKELDDVLKQTESVFGLLGTRLKSQQSAGSGIPAGASGQGQTGAAAGAGDTVAKKFAPTTPLGERICKAIDAGGINIAIYIIGDPNSNNDKEFGRQAKDWAKNHGAFGLNGSKVDEKPYAMPLTSDPGKLVSDLLAALQQELKTSDIIPIANVAIFAHGDQQYKPATKKDKGKDFSMLQVDYKTDKKGNRLEEGWASAGGPVLKDFAAAVKPALTSGSKIHLFACSAAGDRDALKNKDAPRKDKDDVTREDSLAEDLQEMTGAEIWGHETAAHTTGNSMLVMVDDTNTDGNAERYQIRDVFARKFLKHVDANLTDSQMGYLDQKLDISDWIRKSLQFKGGSKLKELQDLKKEKAAKEPKEELSKEEQAELEKLSREQIRNQVFIEEISMIGYDGVFDILIADSPPKERTFEALFPGHTQLKQLEKGAAMVHAEFHSQMKKKVKAITDAKTNSDFPAQ